MALNVPTNSSKITKRGIEYRIHVPRIELLKTDIEINGAYYHTEYANGVPVMYYPSVMIGNQSYPYVGIYDGYDVVKAENFNTNFWINTHLSKLKLIFTNFIQIVWFEHNKLSSDVDVWPERYMDASGEIKTLTEDLRNSDADFKSLRREFLSARYNELRKPISLRWNLKFTKEFSRNVRFSFFADNIVQVSPKYQDNYLQSQRNWYKPYFGAELILNIF